MKLKLSVLSLSLMTCATVNTAQAIGVNGTVTANAVMTESSESVATKSEPVVLMQLKLSKEELRVLNSSRRDAAKRATISSSNLPDNADVDMKKTPVLNQGMHGTCVTFANTGAIDSLIGKGDYVSQLCSLELGNFLEKNAYTYSGWNGSWGPLVLNQLMTHGIVSMDAQKSKGCTGVRKYPTTSSNEGKPMKLDEYHRLSEKLSSQFYWEPILSLYQFLFDSAEHQYDADKVVETVKKELAIKHEGRESRVTFGTIIPYQMCSVGACGKYHKANDTWALTRAMDREFDNWELAGHEMFITGYDDKAVVTDDEGRTHRGVFKLRNSWGKDVGDKGNYYMTYDYFKRFVMEVQKVVKSDMPLDMDK